MRRALLAGGLLAVFVALWSWVASWGSVDDLTLASPGETLDAFADNRALLLDNAWVTLYEVLLGLAVAQGKRVTEYIDYLDEIPNEP